jgi:hypothetical protein
VVQKQKLKKDINMGFKMKGWSPFKIGITSHHHGATGASHDIQMMRHEQNQRLRARDEENKEELLEKERAGIIKRAERKERKAAKRTEQGRDRSAARKTRKAGKLRKAASELTADEVVSRRYMMRM